MIFLAHHIATWLGVSTGVVIAGLIILRKKGMASLKARRQRKSTAAQPQAGR